MTKMLRFKLPVGAIVQGMRHIGDGVFEGTPAPDDVKYQIDGAMPLIFECQANSVEDLPGRIEADAVDGPPKDEVLHRSISLVLMRGKADERFGGIPAALGLSEEEWARRTARKSGVASRAE